MPNNFYHRILQAIHILRYGELPKSKMAPIPELTSEEVGEARVFFPMKKFFIFGHARSGTTMLVRLVRLHPQVYCNYQAHFFTRAPLLQSLVSNAEVRAWLARSSNRWNRGKDLSPVVMRAAADFILEREARRFGKTIVGDKSPSNLMNGEAVRLMYSIYPDASLVYIVRDGRDAALSHRIQGFIDFPDQLSKQDRIIRDDFSRDPQPYLSGKRSLFSENGIRNSAESWVKNVYETETEARNLFKDRYFSLRYEDLLDNTWEEMQRLWWFLGAETEGSGLKETLINELQQNPDAEWQKTKAKELAVSIQKGKRGSWREMFTERDLQIFQEIAGETLINWRYT